MAPVPVEGGHRVSRTITGGIASDKHLPDDSKRDTIETSPIEVNPVTAIIGRNVGKFPTAHSDERR